MKAGNTSASAERLLPNTGSPSLNESGSSSSTHILIPEHNHLHPSSSLKVQTSILRNPNSGKIELIPSPQKDHGEMYRRRPPTVQLKSVKSDRHVHRDISNTSEFRWSDMFQYKGSVLPAILLRCIFFTFWTAAWTTLYKLYNMKWLAVPSQLITILSVVMSLLLVFRNGSSYDRYWEARRLWGTMFTHLRNLSRLIWISVDTKSESDLIQQCGIMNLILAFPIATKHFLRDEKDIHYEDLYHLLSHLPEFGPQTTRKEVLNLPLDISFYITSYVKKGCDAKKIDIPTTNNMLNTLSGLVDVLSNLERIRNSPIPLAYFLHLRQTLFLYLLLLPFQILSTMDWMTIPVCAVATFTLLGIESIGGEIENPFGYDRNDLDLDSFCRTIHDEMEVIVNRSMTVDPTQWNHPVLIRDYDHLFVPKMLATDLSCSST